MAEKKMCHKTINDVYSYSQLMSLKSLNDMKSFQ